MSPRVRTLALVAVAALAVGAAGCGVGAGKGASDVTVTVTRDFGSVPIGARTLEGTPGSETVMRLLQREFSVTTRYGGGFVQSIDGLSGGSAGGRRVDWFYYVNGIEASSGAADAGVDGGDRIWWDRHDWGAAMRVPAVVGSFPEPFVHGTGGRRLPVVLACAPGSDAACATVGDRLEALGVPAARSVLGTGAGEKVLRVLVGPWSQVRRDGSATLIADGPRLSGVYVRITGGGATIQTLDARGDPVRRLGPGSGLVAATRLEEQQPTWVVTGTDAAGVRAAASAFREADLRNRFALAVAPGGGRLALPERAR